MDYGDVDTKREVKRCKTIITSGGIYCKVLQRKTMTGTFLGKFLLKILKPYVVLLTMLISKRKKYIKLTVLIIIITKFCMN